MTLRLGSRVKPAPASFRASFASGRVISPVVYLFKISLVVISKLLSNYSPMRAKINAITAASTAHTDLSTMASHRFFGLACSASCHAISRSSFSMILSYCSFRAASAFSSSRIRSKSSLWVLRDASRHSDICFSSMFALASPRQSLCGSRMHFSSIWTSLLCRLRSQHFTEGAVFLRGQPVGGEVHVHLLQEAFGPPPVNQQLAKIVYSCHGTAPFLSYSGCGEFQHTQAFLMVCQHIKSDVLGSRSRLRLSIILHCDLPLIGFSFCDGVICICVRHRNTGEHCLDVRLLGSAVVDLCCQLIFDDLHVPSFQYFKNRVKFNPTVRPDPTEIVNFPFPFCVNRPR
nr:MAG TPA: hypothetical protein [Caudoviricetes sp.]